MRNYLKFGLMNLLKKTRPTWYVLSKALFRGIFYARNHPPKVNFPKPFEPPKQDKQALNDLEKFLFAPEPVEATPKPKREANQFRANYTQSYPAATKRNGGVRGSTATRWR